MKLVRFSIRIATTSEAGNCIEYANNGERIKDKAGIRRAVDEMLKIAFPEVG